MFAGNLFASAKVADRDLIVCRATTARSRTIKLQQLVETRDLLRRKRDGTSRGTGGDRWAALKIDVVLPIVEATAAVVGDVKSVARR